jgi:hypothetical protein
VTEFGGPEVLEVRDEPEPTAGAGEVLVAPEAVGVNYRDIYEREGRYGGEAPGVAGVEGAGSIVAAGEGVTGLEVGDRIGWVAAPGSYAERVVVPAAKAVPLPDDVSSELATAVLLQGMTAQYLATGTYAVQPGDDVLVHAAAGGVGLLLTQIIKGIGGRVIATTSGGAKAELARNAGADEVIGYEGFAERVRELTDGAGAAVVYDGIGRATFDDSLLPGCRGHEPAEPDASAVCVLAHRRAVSASGRQPARDSGTRRPLRSHRESGLYDPVGAAASAAAAPLGVSHPTVITPPLVMASRSASLRDRATFCEPAWTKSTLASAATALPVQAKT